MSSRGATALRKAEEPLEVQISPRMLCSCGKTARPLTAEEQNAYEEAIRRLERKETREKEK